MTKSILQPMEPKECYLCGKRIRIERHHVMSGTANKKLAEKYGLWLYLCADCHRGTEGAQYDAELNKQLKCIAQTAFEKLYGHKLWMETFRKNYLEEDQI